MSCPYFSPTNGTNATKSIQEGGETSETPGGLTYSSYLKIDKLLDCQHLKSAELGVEPHHDEHLFIITHQAFELWFKQMLHDINSVREIFKSTYVEERKTLTVISRMNRVVAILKLCTEQFSILETMTSQDFLDMREYLESSSGFQSLQFRLLETRLGVNDKLRIRYNNQHVSDVFTGEDRRKLVQAMSEPSLFDVVNDWLERTPGIRHDSFMFWRKFKKSVRDMLAQVKKDAEKEEDKSKRERMITNWMRRDQKFKSLFDEAEHNKLSSDGARRFSHSALQGALMIFFYRDEPRFHVPFQLLQSLTEIDNQFMKFRYNHTCMVQRMIGSMTGSGGSSGYYYLRSTCSDRYKIFPDLLNMATFLVPRERIPPLTPEMKLSLSINEDGDSGCCSTGSDIGEGQ